MKLNVGYTDRLIRALLGAVLLLAWIVGWLPGVWAIVSGILGIVLLLTALMNFCPLYALLGLNSRKKEFS